MLIGAGVGFLSGAFGKGGSAIATPLPWVNIAADTNIVGDETAAAV